MKDKRLPSFSLFSLLVLFFPFVLPSFQNLLSFISGISSVWLERWIWVPEAVGSSPTFPTTAFTRNSFSILCNKDPYCNNIYKISK